MIIQVMNDTISHINTSLIFSAVACKSEWSAFAIIYIYDKIL